MKKVLSLLAVLLMAATSSVQALGGMGSAPVMPTMPEVSDVNNNYVVSISTSSTTSITDGGWYVIYNVGRKAYAYGSGQVTSTAPTSGTTFSSCSPYLLRFKHVSNSDKYVIQNGEGNYYRDLTYNTNAGVTSDSTRAGQFTIAQIVSGGSHWYLKGSQYVMDSNGNVVVGWATSAPTSTSGNDSWRIFPVSLSDPDNLSGGALTTYQLAQGGLYRIHSASKSSQYILENTANNKATTGNKTTDASGNMAQMWIIEHDNSGFTFRNAKTGNYLQDDYTCTPSKYYWTAQLSPNNTSDSQQNIILCHGTVESKKKNCANLNGGNSGLTDWHYDNDHNSEWLLEGVQSSEVDTATVKANLDQVLGVGTLDLEAGAYYQFQSLSSGGVMTENKSNGNVITMAADTTEWNQYWKVVYDSTTQLYTLQSIFSQRYINHKATNSSSSCGGYYMTSSSNAAYRTWKIQPSSYAWQSTYVIAEPLKPTTGLAATGDNCQNAAVSSTTAQWIVKRVDITDEDLASAASDYENFALLYNTSASQLNTRLQTYFADYACTTLKDEYQTFSDDSLTALMTASQLPASLINMALKVKNDTWGHREKEFRIYAYEPYSDPTKWNSTSLFGTGYQLSPQTGPTGISVKRGDVVVIMCDKEAPANAKLTYSSNEGYTVYASETNLNRGVNLFAANGEGFLFIHYIITDTNKKLADFDPITIHIEGGRVQGYFDITRGHTNEDWKDMAATLFKDKIVHLKGHRYEHNINYEDFVNRQLVASELDEVEEANGQPKGVAGIVNYWDKIVNEQNYLMGIDNYKDRFNCMYSASSSSTGNPYASSYGTYYPGVDTEWNYQALRHGRENDGGGNYWCIAHETGHVNQGLIKLCGTTEISNNFFSHVNNWLQGSNVGRYGPWSDIRKYFLNNTYWLDYGEDVGLCSRMYFQLWLYFHLAGNDTTFYPRLFEKFRKDPIYFSRNASSPSSGKTDVLKFAKFCSDVAQADMSEFFQFWGFFKPITNMEIGDYGTFYMTTPQSDIDEALAYMHKYPKKLGNIMFIDERIKEYPAEYVGAPEGTVRLGTSGVKPGNTSVVGMTGMFTDFTQEVDYTPYTCVMRPNLKRAMISSGKGAVGFKFYDANNNLIFVANSYPVDLSGTVTMKMQHGNPDVTLNYDYYSQVEYVTAALGNGTDVIIYDKSGTTTSAIENAVENGDTGLTLANGTRLIIKRTPGIITGINSATVDNNAAANSVGKLDTSAPAYTLDGQLTTSFQKGQIYLQNGNKVKY